MRAVEAGLSAPDRQDQVLIEVIDPATGATRATRTYGEIRAARDRLARRLRPHVGPGTVVGVIAGNTPEWVIADLALLAAGGTEVPVPLMFSAEQAASLLASTAVCLVDEQGAHRLEDWDLGTGRRLLRIDDDAATPGETDEPAALGGPPDDIVKIIHTSGTTGSPKGVLIRRSGLDALLDSMTGLVPSGSMSRYVSMVPFSLLIEQMVAVYLPICVGGSLVLLSPEVPLLGAPGARLEDALGWLHDLRPSAATLPPAVVSALAKAADKAVSEGGEPVRELFSGDVPLLLAGGAPVAAAALESLAGHGIEVLEGYGLSENTSVVAWNRPGEAVPGTVGTPLPHCQVKIGADDELLVKSPSVFAGYTVQDPTSRPVDEDGWLHTGDRARIDDDGRLRILGRLKNMIITGLARNVSPEWVEGRLRSCPSVREAVVFGDGLEHLVAVVVSDGLLPGDAIEEEVAEYSARTLAETDRPGQVIVLRDDPELRERYFTVTGRARRDLLFHEQVTHRLPAASAAGD